MVVEDEELRRFQQAARDQGLTLSEWARQALRRTERGAAVGDPAAKVAVLRAATLHAFPAPDVEQMLSEIERGYHGLVE